MRYGLLCLILAAAIAASGAVRPGSANPAGETLGPAVAATQPLHGDVESRGHDTKDGDLDTRRKLCLMACLALACQAALATQTPIHLDQLGSARPEPAVPREVAQTHLAPRTGPPRDLPSS